MTPPRKKKTKSAAAKPAAKKRAAKKTAAKKTVATATGLSVRKRATRRRRWKWSAESRAKISKSAKQTWQDPGVRARRVAGIRRAMKTPEVRERILARSEERRGRKHTAATIRKMRASALRQRGRKQKKTAARKKRAA